MAVLQLYNATKRFGEKEILSKVSFSLKTGEILGVFGRNGCGKSTLLKILYGTEKANTIDASVNGEVFNPNQNIKKQCIAYLPQSSFLPKNVRVRDIIPMFFDEEKKQDALFYDPLIAKISAKKAGELSMGQLRYFEVLLVGNLTHQFILLDEPFSMIEPLYKFEIQKFLEKIKAEKGIVITDHYYDDALKITSHNLLIKNGISHQITDKESLKKLNYIR